MGEEKAEKKDEDRLSYALCKSSGGVDSLRGSFNDAVKKK